ncbi:hypothetical protein AB0B39_23560 [Micromonospora sp. NPDC049114]|uniref:hypothetical protein n=1 Tax=Micromonospora sp. NPDC049114 TaxID=3155498 RepID=UPI00340FA39E
MSPEPRATLCITNLTVDTRWDYGVIDVDGEPEPLTLPFVGWGDQAWTDAEGPGRVDAAPVFLAGQMLVTAERLSEYAGVDHVLRHLVPVDRHAATATHAVPPGATKRHAAVDHTGLHATTRVVADAICQRLDLDHFDRSGWPTIAADLAQQITPDLLRGVALYLERTHPLAAAELTILADTVDPTSPTG